MRNLWVFSCFSIIFLQKAHLDWKLGPYGANGILLEYENANMAYFILGLANRKVVITKHLNFDKASFTLIKEDHLAPLVAPWGTLRTCPVVVDEVHPKEVVVVDETHTSAIGESNEHTKVVLD
ncbi:hypothetical protein O181_004499 [Austropuccinia psidii MF-1]|uniref:Uncharacterized protein n=1 Tax=Austropuccinia psidii MF-1 TaxID=1389203 RepID=A0A9Q3GEX6_9BASI|nr:hypothetical protein [Austropuccinia psidii MF-1]